MSDARNLPDDRPNVGSMPLEDEIQALQGEAMPDDQDGALDLDELEGASEPTRTELDSGAVTVPDREFIAEGRSPDAVVSLDDAVDAELRDGETDDPLVAIQEGFTYVPPSDPPTVPSDDPQGIDIAAGFGAGASGEPLDDDHRGGGTLDESDMNARIREAIRGDAATSPYADELQIAVVGTTVVLRGVVDEIDDGDTLAAVVEQVSGVTDVRDETEVRGLG
ncbi:MAG: hypothetical protein QOF49_1209 [Chloroflexota bacterium]|jgi:hypothetical protein|nr:hypothetical protein [Chloroflexota bacterium]